VQKNGQLGLHDAVTQFDRGLSDVIDGADDVFHQLIEFIRAAVVGLAVRASRQCLIS